MNRDIQCGLDGLYQSLCDVRSAIAKTAAQLALNPTGLKSDYSIDGQSVTHSSLMKQYKELLESEQAIIQAIVRAEGPFQHNVSVWT